MFYYSETKYLYELAEDKIKQGIKGFVKITFRGEKGTIRLHLDDKLCSEGREVLLALYQASDREAVHEIMRKKFSPEKGEAILSHVLIKQSLQGEDYRFGCRVLCGGKQYAEKSEFMGQLIDTPQGSMQENTAVKKECENTKKMQHAEKGQENSQKARAAEKERENAQKAWGTEKKHENAQKAQAAGKERENAQTMQSRGKEQENTHNIQSRRKERENGSETQSAAREQEIETKTWVEARERENAQKTRAVENEDVRDISIEDRERGYYQDKEYINWQENIFRNKKYEVPKQNFWEDIYVTDLTRMKERNSRWERFTDNSFLLHGFYNYKHVIVTDKLLGVPGNYYDREKQVALMFGFESFLPVKELEGYLLGETSYGDRQISPGTFGYYFCQTD